MPNTLPLPSSATEASLDAIVVTEGSLAGGRSLLLNAASADHAVSQQSPTVLSQQQILLAAQSLKAKASAGMRPTVLPPLEVTIRQTSTGSSKGGIQRMDSYHHTTSMRKVSMSYYDKQLGNDVTDEDAYEILSELSKSDSRLRVFTDAELHELCTTLTILKIEQGETVMKVGESASFFALLLQGSCVATVNASIGSLPLPRGSWLGEMSYFEHGTRSADVSAAEDSVLAMMTYKELDALAHTAPMIHSKLQKLLAMVSIRKLHERIDVMASSTAAPPSHSRKPSLMAAGEMFLRSPSQHGRKMLATDSGVSTVKGVRRQKSEASAAGLPYGLNTASTPRADSRLHVKPSYSYSTDDLGTTQPTTPRAPPNMPKSPRGLAQLPTTDIIPVSDTGLLLPARQPSSDFAAASPQPETLLRKRLATTLQIRDTIIYQDNITADFEIADAEARVPASGGDGDAEGSTQDAANKLLQLHPSIKSLQQMTHKQKQDVWDTYHTNVVNGGTANKVLQPAELRALSRDVIELILRNYVRWLKQTSHSRKKSLTEADCRAILQVEREYLLPGKKGQTDAQAINAMARHLTGQMTASKAKSNVPSALKGSIPTITLELFAMSFDRAMRDCLHIKTKDPGLGCSIQ